MKVSGTISDNYGGLVGASIILLRNGSRTNIATSSNDNGQFIIDNDDIVEDDSFEIRFLGFQPQIIKAKDLQDAQINLEESSIMLDEIIVTATKLGTKPTDTSSSKLAKSLTSTQFYKTPLFVISVLGLATLGIVIYVIKKSK